MDTVLTDISTQRKRENKLRLGEEKFRIATRNSSVSFWTYYFDKKQIVQSDNSKTLHGHDDVVNNVPDSLIESGYLRQDSIQDFLTMYNTLRSGVETASGDFWFRNTKGQGWWCEHIDYTNVFDTTGKPIYAYAVGTDITQAKIAQRRYQEEAEYSAAIQEERLLVKVRSNITQNIVESYIARDNVGISTNGTSYTLGTEQLASTGLTEEQQNNIRNMLDRERVLKAFEDGERFYTLDYQRKAHDGTVFWVNTTVKTFQNPETKDIMSFMYSYDINEEKLKDGIINTVSLLEHDFIFYLDLKTNKYRLFLGNAETVDVPPASGNDYVEMLTAINNAVIIPEDIERSIHDFMPETIIENLKIQKIFSAVYGAYDTNGLIRQKRFQCAYLDKETKKVIITRSDVTELLNLQKQNQERLELALIAAEQANSAKSKFLSHMSHEIRTPMNAIIGMSAIAAQSIGDDEQIADCLSKIGSSSRFLLSLINDILDMSRIESGKVLLNNTKIPFEEFIGEVNSISYSQAKAKNIDYESIVDSSVNDYYIGDSMKLQQIIINILSNAIKFTPKHGKVLLNIRQVKRDKNNAVVRFVINDTGCGINEEFIPKLFEPFAQEQTSTTVLHSGTGLGLAICKNLVSMMDGTINVRSIVGVGSEFTIDVKLGISEESKTRYLKKPHINFSGLKTLVVDDDVLICEHAVHTLKEMGITSEWVDSGKKAVELAKAKRENNEQYDLILIDWKMPEIDGIETTKQIRQIVGEDGTIIIMTSYDWIAIDYEAKQAGVDLLINKPLFKSSLISAFEKVLSKKQENKEPRLKDDFNFAGKRILLAEDHPINVEVARKLLEHKGFLVEHAPNGVSAIEMYAKAPIDYYDAILMDIRMPQMDGLQAAQTIRHMSKDTAQTIPIIAMTANAFEDDIQKSKAAGMNAHLAKPIDSKQMFQTLFDFIYRESKEINL
ncbi:MAG: response regulator [Synergistaceae bacterium]